MWALLLGNTDVSRGAVPRSMHLVSMCKGDHHQILLINIPISGIITRCKRTFLHNFHKLQVCFPDFSQGSHPHLTFLLSHPHSQAIVSLPSSQCSLTTSAAAFPLFSSHFCTLRTSQLCCYFPSWCFQPKPNVK